MRAKQAGFDVFPGRPFLDRDADHLGQGGVNTIEELARVAGDTFISCYPNAGLPNPMSDTGFDETPEITGALLEEFAKSGFLNIAGGCCGTTPEHIAQIAARVGRYQPRCRHGALFGDLVAA